MHIVEFECKICNTAVSATHPDMEIWEMEMVLADLEQAILLNKMCCHSCGEIGPITMRLKEGLSAVVLSEKIISPMSYTSTNCHNEHNMEKYEYIDCDESTCTMCTGTGNIEIAYQAHKKEDINAINYEQCPICNGKGNFKEDRE